jgi:K+-sensing histidine kinase KdpD
VILLSNAVKFTDKGEVTISVSSRKLRDTCHEIHFAVKDTGISILEALGKKNCLFKSLWNDQSIEVQYPEHCRRAW